MTDRQKAIATVNPVEWGERVRATGRRALANDKMDSGWSSREASDCNRELLSLYHSLIESLADVPINTEDAFDRPALFAALSAIYESRRKEVPS